MFSWLYYRFLLCAGSMLGFQIIPRQGMLYCLLFLVHVHGDGQIAYMGALFNRIRSNT